MAGKRTAPKGVTLADVAREAGVAPMTVSRYLNNHPNISDKTGRKVAAAIKRLNYSPNLAARMLMGQPSNAIGLIVPNLGDPFFAEVAHNIQEVARERRMLVWVAASNSEKATEISLIEQMKQHRVDGILLIPTSGSYDFDFSSGNPPIVALDRPLPGNHVDAVLVENRRSSAEAVEHLIGHGYRRIICISVDLPELYTIHERISGYEDAMRRNRLRVEVAVSKSTVDEIKSFLLAALEKGQRIEAIFTTNNVTTIHVMEALYELGLTVPTDIALAGFDDFEFAALTHPSLTVVRQPTGDLGRQAARLLFERISSSEAVHTVSIALPASLIVRESCGCKPTRRVRQASLFAKSARPSVKRLRAEQG
jgi:LacI family transcriptional regulator